MDTTAVGNLRPNSPSTAAQPHSGKAPAVAVRGISKSFGDNIVLDDVDLDIAEGAVYGLLGPNGAGKTTLIRILTTLLKPTAGSASIFGIDVASDAKTVRNQIGLAGQFAAVDAHLTGRENLVMVGRLYNLSKKEAQARADDVLERIHLVDAKDRRAGEYSGGMKRRLDLAASMVGRPRILFLDEPTTGVDPRSRLDIWDLIEEMVGEGTTLLLTTQYLDEAERLADKIGVIDGGHLIAEGTADELKDQMGGDRVEITVDPSETEAARALLATVSPDVTVDAKFGRLSVAAAGGTADLMTVMRQLESSDVNPLNIGLRRPSLDDVFLQLTDHTVTGANQQ